MTGSPAWVERVLSALISGELTREDLTARRLSAFLGQSTMGLYHHFGSLDGFLIQVDGAGWDLLVDTLRRRAGEGAGLADLAISYLDFAFQHPHLYWLMAERRFDREALRKEQRLSREQPLWSTFTELVRQHGGKSPVEDTRVLFAGLHGLAVLTLNGRGAIGAPGSSGEALARESARHLVAALVGSAGKARRSRSARPRT
jgi:AcrR family transcriptional regulator